MIRFIHTADLQLGKPYGWAMPRTRVRLSEFREAAIDKLANLVNEHDVDFILVAGDFFDANTIGDDVVSRTCERLKAISVPVYILPGNHDCCGTPDSVYKRKKFADNVPENIVVLDDETPHVLTEGKVLLLAAPLQRKSQTGDTTSHIKAESGRDLAPNAIRLGVAHGGVVDFSEGDAMNRIDPDRATAAELDYLALGDWHGLKKVNERTWYSGTPEPDSFQENAPGHMLVVEIEKKGVAPNVRPIQTASTTWLRYTAELFGEEDVDALEKWIAELDDPINTLVRVEITGSLDLTQTSRCQQLVSDLEDKLLHVRKRGPGVSPKPSQDELLEIASGGGYVGLAVERLAERAELSGKDGETAGRALELLHHFRSES